MLALYAAFHAILTVGKRDFSIVELQQRFLHQILNLFDVNEKRAFTAHSKFNFGLYLASDDFIFALGNAGRCNGVCDFVAEPRHHAWFARSIARHISADDARELNDVAGGRLIAEDKLRVRGFHFFGYLS